MSTRDNLTRLWQSSPPLVVVGVLMLAAAAASAIGILTDPREITGAPAWLKPFKFAVSTAVYSLTLAWIFSWLPEWPRLRRIVGWSTAIVFVLEVALIDVQAWRGTTSHFNASTPLDMTVVIVMGSAIVLQTLMSVGVAVALWRQRFADRTLGWALRLGLTLTILGAMTGGLMTRPTDAQLAQVKAGGPMPVVGAHTVGGPDGGPGLPVMGWSREHGDLRIPHFIGLHAMQVLPLIAVGLRRWRRPEASRVRMLFAAAASYAALFVLLLLQALNGVSLIAGDKTTSGLLAGWALVSLLIVSICAISDECWAWRQRGPNLQRVR
ncbi:MAG TPA: hypothetical protein VFO21_26195 [Vicinamibacterales bacterium]|nr:hypothetical protein [Vicinamibacterales bacterium]